MHSKYLYSAVVVAVVLATVFLYRTNPLETPIRTEPTNAAMFGGVSLTLEFATTTAARELGLGGRTSLLPDYGMLFVFRKDDKYGFWMKDTLVPLDIFWLDGKGQVVYVAADVATSSYPAVFYPPFPARYVLETVAGFAHEHSINVGTTLRLQNFPTVTE